jgi:hypothetical protein
MAIRLDPRRVEAFGNRAEVYLKKNDWGAAIADMRKVLALPARSLKERDAQIKAAETLMSLAQKDQNKAAIPISAPATPPLAANPPPAVVAPPPQVTASTQTGRRIALVLGNSAYQHAGVLKNPANDAKAIAAAMRGIGFTEVIDRYDLDLAQTIGALKDFGDRSGNAEWAVIYFAGHGVEMNGTAYLIPTDAKLERDSHVAFEAVPLDRMLQVTERAKRLRLVILDACRNNPFVTRMVRTGSSTRSLGTGLPAIEVEGDVLVAYATKHGTTALDGEGDNSPYAVALAKNISEPNVDIRVMFGRVRDAVRRATNNLQEPYTYGSIGGDLHYFAVSTR